MRHALVAALLFIDQSHFHGHMSALLSFRSWVRKTLER